MSDAPAPPPLHRLLGPAEAAGILGAFQPLFGPVPVAIAGTSGRLLAGDGRAVGGRSHPLGAPGGTAGTLHVGEGAPEAAVEALRAALDAILQRAHDMRAMAGETLERYREVNLLYGIAERMGATLDPGAIHGRALAEAARAVRSDVSVALVDGPGGFEVRAAGGTESERALELMEVADRLMRSVRETSLADSAADSLGSRFGSAIAVPLRIGAGRPVAGILLFGRLHGAPAFTASDQQLLAAIAGQAGIALETARLHEREVEQRLVDEELAMGRRIQLSLLPQRIPSLGGWEIAPAYRAAREVGGDVYDLLVPTGESSQLGVVVADATGKGVPAALMIANVRALLRAESRAGPGPGAVLDRVGRLLVEDGPTRVFVTALYLTVDLATGAAAYASAGHDWPLRLAAGGGPPEFLASTGSILGIPGGGANVEQRLTLEPGDLLLLYTDGVTEARDEAGEFFGEERLVATAERCRGMGAAAVCAAILAEIDAFTGAAAPFDDLTLVVVRRSPAA
jgi:serine phosphatase RsbU (regulator of sigma subunit)